VTATDDTARRELSEAMSKLEHCLSQLTDEQAWWRPRPEMNSIANELAKPVVEQETPYSPFFQDFSAGYARLRRIAGTPDDIAKLVLKALTVEKPRPRYAGPRHARVFIALKRWLPERLFEYFVNHLNQQS